MSVKSTYSVYLLLSDELDAKLPDTKECSEHA